MFEKEWLAEKVDRHLAAAKTLPFGVSYLDDALHGIFPNELMLIGARTGMGKTALATSIAIEASKRNRKVVFFALEADQWEIQRRIKYRKMVQLYQENYANSANTFKFPRYREWLMKGYDATWDAIEKIAEKELKMDTLTLEIYYRGANYTPNQFIDELNGIQDVDLILVDHLHYFDITGMGDSETEGLKRAIHAIRNAALYHNKPVILLAHLRKQTGYSKSTLPGIDDFHGHSDIAKVSTTILLTAPATDVDVSLGSYPTYFHVAKCRTAGEVTPFVGVLGFDFAKNAYSDRYYVRSASHFEDPKEIEDPAKIPEWAKRAIRPSGSFIGVRQTRRREPNDD